MKPDGLINDTEGARYAGGMAAQQRAGGAGLITVTIDGQDYVISDIGMRMLSASELFKAQGFPPDFIIAPPFNGKPMTKTSQVARCGNSVCPPLPKALVAANLPELCEERKVA